MQVTDGIWRFGTRHVNWYAVEDGGRLTLVDAGMPGHWPQLEAGLRRLGKDLRDVEAIVLTHAHADHVGFAERARGQGDVDVLVDKRDADGRVRKMPPLHLYWRPTSWPLLAEGLRNGLLATKPVREYRTFGGGDVLDVPGHPRVLATFGHTAGSVALLMPERGVAFTGDALVTLDPYTRGRGPRLLLDAVNEDTAQAKASLPRLADVEADWLLPGHGEPWRGRPADAVAQALRTQDQR